MKIKKFQAKSMPEAMQQIRKELGADAVILQSKEVKKGGVFGLFKNRRIEVVAALDPTPPQNTPEQTQSPKPMKIPKQNERQTTENQQVLKELQYMKALLKQQSKQSSQQFSPVVQSIYHYLLKQEVEETLVLEWLQAIESDMQNTALDSKEECMEALRRTIIDAIGDVSDTVLNQQKKVIQFVGPTGVGKTTTLAKVAAKTILETKKRIAFITMDTYRIAAIDQLKTYARILDVPIEVAYSLDDYQQALKTFADYDFIFVDTAGRNFRNPQYLHELERTLAVTNKQVETVLVLALTAKAQDIHDIYKQFEPLGIGKVIFTKLDETVSYGSIFNICLGEQKKIMYLTNGQNVPDDLIKPSTERMVQLLLSRYDYD